jgi:uncharacterized protein with FMN-binding domain
MGKSSLSWVASALAVLGAAITAGYLSWGTITGVVMLLAAGAIAAGIVATQYAGSGRGRRVAGQKISPSLITLSCAAIFAVYAAGYHHTGSAADEFDAQAARRKTAAPIAARGEVPRAVSPRIEALAVVPPPPAATPAPKKESTQASAAETPTTPPDPEPIVDLPPSLPPPRFSASGDNPRPADAAVPSATTPQPPYKDGTYLGWGTCRHGDIQASVVIQDGKIASTAIAQCLTRYSCSWIADLPGEVVSRQNANVDYVSGATQSSDAFSDAVNAALTEASE